MPDYSLKYSTKAVTKNTIACVVSDFTYYIDSHGTICAVPVPAETEPTVLFQNKKGWSDSIPLLGSKADSAKIVKLHQQVAKASNHYTPNNLDQFFVELGVPKKAQFKRYEFAVNNSEFQGIKFLNGAYWFRSKTQSALALLLREVSLAGIEIYDTNDMGQLASAMSRLSTMTKLLVDNDGFLACDVETFDPFVPCGPYGLNPARGKVRMIQLHFPKAQVSIVLDLGGRGNNVVPSGLGRALTRLFLVARGVVFHNALFDMGFLTWQIGVKFDTKIKVLDTVVLSQNLWAGIKQFRHDLGSVARRLGLGDVDKSLQTSDFGAPLVSAQIKYGVDDVLITWAIFIKLSNELRNSVASNLEAARLDCRFLTVLNDMRVKGFPVDRNEITRNIEQTEEYLGTKAAEFMSIVGVEYSKRGQVLEYFQTKYGAEAFPNLTKATLNRNIICSEVQILLDCKFAAIRGPYSRRLHSSIINGTVRGGFRVLATQGMGRTSCSATDGIFVQLQNPAKENDDYPEIPDVRKCFVAGINTRRGIKRKMAVIDLKAAHLRVALDITNQKDQIDLTLTGADNHSYNAVKIVNATCADKYPHLTTLENFVKAYESGNGDAGMLRQLAKNGIYTKLNLGSGYSLQQTMAKTKIVTPIETCNLVMDGLGEVIPNWIKHCFSELKVCNKQRFGVGDLAGEDINWATYEADNTEEDFEDSVAEDPKNKSSSFSGVFGLLGGVTGRYRYVPQYYRQGKYGTYASAKVNDVSSFLVQAPEADIMKRAGYAFYQWLDADKPKNVDCWLANFAHDEFDLVADEDFIETATKELLRLIDVESRKVCKRLPLVEPDKFMSNICDTWAEK